MFRVQFFSAFYDKWEDYSAITFNSRPVDYPSREQAEAALAIVQQYHPRDIFRVVEYA